MKKLLLFTAFTFLFSNISIAQEFTFGAKLGVNLASMTNLDVDLDPGETIKGRINFHLGAVGEYSFSDKFSGQAEFLYSGLGSKYNDSDEGYSSESTTKLAYISIPLLAKYYITEAFSLEAGPQFSFLISAKGDSETIDDGEIISEQTFTGLDIKAGFKGLDLGFGVGGTYKLEGGMFFSLRYVLGLSSIYNAIPGEVDPKVKNNVFQVSAGYKFN